MKNRRKIMAKIGLGILLGLSWIPVDAAEIQMKETEVALMASGDVAINAINFPDANFRKYISDHIDLDGTMSLGANEISRCTSLSVADCGIKSLEGIEYFTNLTSLYCENNELTSLDVSKNTALSILNCSHNRLTSLNVSKNLALTDLSLSYNKLTGLDVSKNTALTSLGCTNNNLSGLDVSKNTALTFLSCGDNKLTNLNVTQNTALITLVCYNNKLTSLDVSKNTVLKNLYCEHNELNSLNVSANTALLYLHCYGNQLSSLDISKNTALVEADYSGNTVKIPGTKKDLSSSDPNFNPKKVSNLKGIVLTGSVLSFQKGMTKGSYVYDCGRKQMTVSVYKVDKEWVFTDVQVIPGNWKYENVKAVYNDDLMGAVGGGTQFQPDGYLTRAMFATVLYRMAGEPTVAYRNKFTDVAAGKWYTDAIIWANEKGIVNGYLNGSYGINDNITREQIAKMIFLYGQLQKYQITSRASIEGFTDRKDVSAWGVEYLQWCVDVGMISGKPNGDGSFRLDPKGQATRAECAKMLIMFLQKYQ